MISSHHLRVFEAVARAGSFGGAANTLQCTQSTVSHHLAALEAQLDTTLLVRGRRGVGLTDRGRVLLDHAELILSQLEAAERAVHDSASLREGTLRVGTFASAGATLLPRLLMEFRAEHPGVEITVVQGKISVDEVRAGRLDVGIISTTPDYWVRPIPGLSLVRLLDDPFSLALPAGHPLAGRQSIALGELTDERWITTPSDRDPSHALLLRAARAAGFEPRISVNADDYTVIGNLIAAGIGVAIVPRLAHSRLPEGVAIVDLAEAIARDISAVVLADGSSVTATAFMRQVRRAFMQEAALTYERTP